MILRQLILFATWCAAATACFAEWEIVSVSTEPFSRESGTGPPELRLHLSLRNASDREILVMGQQFPTGRPFYLIEAFIQNAENAVWERKNTAMCGSSERWDGSPSGRERRSRRNSCCFAVTWAST